MTHSDETSHRNMGTCSLLIRKPLLRYQYTGSILMQQIIWFAITALRWTSKRLFQYAMLLNNISVLIVGNLEIPGATEVVRMQQAQGVGHNAILGPDRREGLVCQRFPSVLGSLSISHVFLIVMGPLSKQDKRGSSLESTSVRLPLLFHLKVPEISL